MEETSFGWATTAALGATLGPSARRAAADRELRADLIDIALGAQDDPDDRLGRFLGEERLAVALRQWFGDEVMKFIARGRFTDIRLALDRDLADLDEQLSRQLNAILHAPPLQALEARWRGTHYLVQQPNDKGSVLIRLLDVRWSELEKDFARAVEFDQSNLFAKIYNEEFGTPGGQPYGLLLVDHAVCHRRLPGRSADDIGVLAGLAQVAAAAFACVVCGVAPQFFGLESFAELTPRVNLDGLLHSPDYQRWRMLQQNEDSRFLGLVLPRILIRAPWSDDGRRRDGFRYREDLDGLRDQDFLWASGIFAFAAVALRAFRTYGWFANIRGAPRDQDDAGLVSNLPAPPFTVDTTDFNLRRPIEIEFSDRQEKSLSELGFIGLAPARLTRHLAFMGNQSVFHPPVFETMAARTNHRISSMLQYVLCVSRFSHYLKVIARDRVGASTTPEDLERRLADWLRSYATGNDDADSEMRARFPLRDSRVQVSEVLGKPGIFACSIYLQPHYQLDEVVASFKIQTELTALGGK